MSRTVRSRLALALAVTTAAGLAVPAAASAHGPRSQRPTSEVTYLVATLDGSSEVPGAPGTPAVGDPDGRAVEVLRIEGNQISFAIRWTGIGAPTAGHLHLGAAGVNGPLKVLMFGPLPATLNAVAGTVTVDDPALLDSLTADPGAFYTNLHNAEFPGGALRGQLRKATGRPALADALS
ncbi:CHRD domain-containing protein [Planosporangium sp. 12N6]|uniref:CHRD domain-containing protein n=1 Tax=Planosporangium spinosum TaxID=3402278 RepID=UPI003CF13ECF